MIMVQTPSTWDRQQVKRTLNQGTTWTFA
jgi:hypothetical protein